MVLFVFRVTTKNLRIDVAVSARELRAHYMTYESWNGTWHATGCTVVAGDARTAAEEAVKLDGETVEYSELLETRIAA